MQEKGNGKDLVVMEGLTTGKKQEVEERVRAELQEYYEQVEEYNVEMPKANAEGKQYFMRWSSPGNGISINSPPRHPSSRWENQLRCYSSLDFQIKLKRINNAYKKYKELAFPENGYPRTEQETHMIDGARRLFLADLSKEAFDLLSRYLPRLFEAEWAIAEFNRLEPPKDHPDSSKITNDIFHKLLK
jgi:hypothetical protein